jgi:hypothetical protein
MIVPFHLNPRVRAILEPFYVAAGALALGLAPRRVIDRFLAEGDPRRLYIAQAILYGGAFVIVALSVWLRHRG